MTLIFNSQTFLLILLLFVVSYALLNWLCILLDSTRLYFCLMTTFVFVPTPGLRAAFFHQQTERVHLSALHVYSSMFVSFRYCTVPDEKHFRSPYA